MAKERVAAAVAVVARAASRSVAVVAEVDGGLANKYLPALPLFKAGTRFIAFTPAKCGQPNFLKEEPRDPHQLIIR